MDLKVLRYLIGIVEAGGFGKAAKQLHLSQPALSKAIANLEQELDVVLLERGKRGQNIRLTPAGEVVCRHASHLLDGRMRMLQELENLNQLKGGLLRIGLSPLGSGVLFAPIIARFRQAYPKVKIELMEQGGAAQEEALRNSEVELAMSMVPQNNEFNWLQMRDDPMMVALPHNHPLANMPSLTLSELVGGNFITFEDTFALGKLINRHCLEAGVSHEQVMRVSQIEFGMALVASGAGALPLPQLIAEQLTTPGVILKPLISETLRWKPSVIWRKDATLSFAAEALMQMIRERYANVPLNQ